MRFILFVTIMILSVSSFAQKLEYSVLFHGIGDNREYSREYATPQTILGERSNFEIGTTLEEKHQFRVGLSHLFEFGSEINDLNPNLIAYYRYADNQKTFYFGAFPRMGLINYPLALLTDTLNYYRPNVEGMYGNYKWSWGNQSGFVDWTSRQTDNKRETFMAGFSGKIQRNSFFIENYLLMFHHAGTALRPEGEHISDNLGMALYLGADLEKLIPLKKAYIKAGLLESSLRERGITDGYISGWSFTGELYGECKNFALKTTFHQGDGHLLMNGDRFYDTESYLRTDVYWKFINNDNIQGRFNLSFHLIDGSTLDQSQQLSLVYKFGNN